MLSKFRSANYRPRFIAGFVLGAMIFGTSAYAITAANTPSTGYVLCVGGSTKTVYYTGALKCPEGRKMLVLGAKGEKGDPGVAGKDATVGSNVAINSPIAIRSVLRKVDSSVYNVTCGSNSGAAVGVDVSVSAAAKAKGLNGSLITTYGLVKNCLSGGIKITKGGVDQGGVLWSWDPATDLALLHTSNAVNHLVSSQTTPTVGDFVLAIGGSNLASQIFTTGVISNGDQNALYSTAPTNATFTGGPLVDIRGEILGFISGPDAVITKSINPGMLCRSILSCPDSSYFLKWSK